MYLHECFARGHTTCMSEARQAPVSFRLVNSITQSFGITHRTCQYSAAGQLQRPIKVLANWAPAEKRTEKPSASLNVSLENPEKTGHGHVYPF